MQNDEAKIATQVNNKRIAQNTLLLYVRMLFIMGVSLYTSRVVLQTLGVEDFGTFGVVGSIITMFTFINAAMVTATQRYLTFEIGRNNLAQLQKVFSTSLQIHLGIALIIILLSETVGLWLLYNKLEIPATRLQAAFWVFQCSIAACVTTIMTTPYKANIIAHEEMSAFAYITIVEVILKLGIVYLLYLLPFDKLIIYAVLILCVQIMITLSYIIYCKRHYKETTYSHSIDRPLLYEMAGFAGWSFWGNLAYILNTQGINILLNTFFGLVVNAAREFAVQIQTAVQQFVGNFQMALNPQITKTFAANEIGQMHILMQRSARFSFFLLYLLALPVIIETPYILSLWLKNVPPHTATFTQLMLIVSLISTSSSSCVIANQATGKVKRYQAIVGGILLLSLPISYATLHLGAPAYAVFIVAIFIEIIAQIARLWLLRPLINLSVRTFLQKVYLPISLVLTISLPIPIMIWTTLEEGFIRLIAVGFACTLSVGISTLTIGLTKGERKFIIDRIRKITNSNITTL